jgi:hypothetical protein
MRSAHDGVADYWRVRSVAGHGQYRIQLWPVQIAELQAYSMTMYTGWRQVIAKFAARRSRRQTTDLLPQTVAWMLLGIASSGYEHWLDSVVTRWTGLTTLCCHA